MDAANGVGLFKTVLIKMAGATGKASACPSQVTKPVHGTMVEIVAGRYCLQGRIQDNGGIVPSSIPLANGNTHVSTEFECDEGYPVKFSSFNGGHTANSTENGKNWIPTETWEFFTRF